MSKHVAVFLLLLAIVITMTTDASAQASRAVGDPVTGGTWRSSRQGSGSTLTFNSSATPTDSRSAISVQFAGDARDDRNSHGVVGFEIYLRGLAAYKGFSFDDFEGPDALASAAKQVTATVRSASTPPLVLRFAASGWYPAKDEFAFGMMELSSKAGTQQKALIRALAAGADTLQISIADFKDARRRIDFTIPVSGEGKNFARLLQGMN